MTMPTSVIAKFIVEFLEMIDADDADNNGEDTMEDELKELIAAAVAHGAYRALQVNIEGYVHSEEEVESVSAMNMMDEASGIVQTLFEGDESEGDDESDDDSDDGGNITDILGKETINDISNAQSNIDRQLKSSGSPREGWIDLSNIVGGKRKN
jgi:hypothetical protein